MGVQSSVVPPMDLADKFQAFVDGPGLMLLENMPPHILCQMIGALVGQLREQPLKNADLQQVQWPQIAEFRYTFDILQRQIESAQRVKKEDLVEYYKTYLTSDAPERRMVRLITLPANAPIPDTPRKVQDANDVKEWQALQAILPGWMPLM